ncbi:MAG: DUF5320 family protein [Bacteroidota bacterium]
MWWYEWDFPFGGPRFGWRGYGPGWGMGFRAGWGPYWHRPTREEEIEWLEEEARELRRALEEIEARLSELRSSK